MYATPTAISSNSRKTCASHDNEVGSGISNFAFWLLFSFRRRANDYSGGAWIWSAGRYCGTGSALGKGAC